MDAEEIDDLITNYSEFEKKIDDKIQAYQKLKDSPDSIATAILIQSVESQKRSNELAERMFHLSRVMVIFAGGALIIATGALTFASLGYFDHVDRKFRSNCDSPGILAKERKNNSQKKKIRY
jgi:hypothetical protein